SISTPVVPLGCSLRCHCWTWHIWLRSRDSRSSASRKTLSSRCPAIVLGPDHMLLRYAGTGRRSGEPDFVALMGSLYVRIAGQWRLANYQQTQSPAVDGLG